MPVPATCAAATLPSWEQSLPDRLRGEPLELEVRMQPQSILYRTLMLFASMLAAVALLFGVTVWRVVRGWTKKGRVGDPYPPACVANADL